MTKKNTFNPWPVAIALICISAFAGAVLVVVIMVQQRVELVRPDYYAQDQRHEERMQQEKRAGKNPADIVYDEASNTITIQFPGPDVSGNITLFRPSDLQQDRETAVTIDENNRQVLDASGMIPGLWRVRVEWFMGADGYYQEKTVTIP